jgi:hypothetical protein
MYYFVVNSACRTATLDGIALYAESIKWMKFVLETQRNVGLTRV